MANERHEGKNACWAKDYLGILNIKEFSEKYYKDLFNAHFEHVRLEYFLYGKARGRIAWNNFKKRYRIVEHRKKKK